MLKYRWINPDEGAHLADAQLLLAGEIPFVDYLSRQPFYIFLLALFLKIFGMSYLSGRLLPLFSSIGVSILIYLIAKHLFNRRVALTAQLLYVFFPFTILFSSITKMNNVVTFWGCLGIFFYLIYRENGKVNRLYWSGLAFGLAYYVRESSVAVFATILLSIIFFQRKRVTARLSELIVCIAGFGSIAGLVFFLYLNYLSFNEFWNSTLNPLYLPVQSIARIIAFFSVNTRHPLPATPRIPGQDLHTAAREVTKIYRMNLYLLIGFGFYLGYFLKAFIRGKGLHNPQLNRQIILPLWFMLSLGVYGYYFYARGFFSEYAIELYPPLIIGFSYLLVEKLIPKPASLHWYLLTFIVVAYGIFAFQKLVIVNIDLSTCYLILLILTAIYLFWRKGSFAKTTTLNPTALKKLLIVPILMTAFIYSFSTVARHLGLSYNGVWSPATVVTVEKYLTQDSHPGDTVLSGGMIWTIQPHLKPFLKITHPIAFVSEPNNRFKRKLAVELSQNLPTYIIMDGITSRCYAFIRFQLKDILKKQYLKSQIIKGERQGVVIYKIRFYHPRHGM